MKTACPKCREKGRDSTGDNLHVNPDGSAKCFHPSCKAYYKDFKGSEAPKTTYSRLSVAQVESYPIGTDPSRKITEKVATEYGIRCAFDEETGKPKSIYYPYYEGTSVTGYKARTLPKTFSVVGDSASSMFGKHACKGKGRYLFITEGEEDTLAVKTMLGSLEHDVVSVPNGANLDKAVHSDLAFFSEYKRIYLAIDGDAPGKELVSKLGDWLVPITEVRVMDHIEYKDPSAYLVAGAELRWKALIKSARVYEPEGVINGVDIDLDDLLTPLPEGYPVPFDGLQEKIHGVRKGEILTLCAGSGIGKTTLMREITKSLIEQGLSVANVALEDQMNVTAQALLALDMDIPLSKFRFSPPTKAESQPSHDKLIANGNTYFYKHFGGLNSESLMNKLEYYARSKSCDFIVLDHLSMVISSSESRNERKDIDTLMTKLAKMVVETGVGLIQIVHLKRKPDGSSYAKGGEVELSDLRGSAALEQLSWAVVGMERDQQGDDTDFSRLRVLKNRTFGFTGLADEVKYNTLTGRMTSIKSEPPDLDTEEVT